MGLPGVKARCWQGYVPSLQKRESFSLGDRQIPCLFRLLELPPFFVLGPHCSTSASVVTSPSLTLTLLPPSYKDTGLTQIIQDNCPIARSLSSLLSFFCQVRYDIQTFPELVCGHLGESLFCPPYKASIEQPLWVPPK